MIFYSLVILIAAKSRGFLTITTPADRSGFETSLGYGSELSMSIHYAVQETPAGLAQAYTIGKYWTYFSTHPGRQMWRAVASEVHLRWRKKVDVMSVARARTANYAGMTVVDERSVKYVLKNMRGTSDV